MPRTAALYCRVSTMSQSCEAQKLELLEVAARAGWNVVEVYSDQGISGAKGCSRTLSEGSSLCLR